MVSPADGPTPRPCHIHATTCHVCFSLALSPLRAEANGAAHCGGLWLLGGQRDRRGIQRSDCSLCPRCFQGRGWDPTARRCRRCERSCRPAAGANLLMFLCAYVCVMLWLLWLCCHVGHRPVDYARDTLVVWLLARFHGRDGGLEPLPLPSLILPIFNDSLFSTCVSPFLSRIPWSAATRTKSWPRCSIV